MVHTLLAMKNTFVTTQHKAIELYPEIAAAPVKTSDELKQQLTLLRKEQFNLRFQVTNGQNENPARFKHIRREIACIKTILNNIVPTKI